jgi:hypothetical protein
MRKKLNTIIDPQLNVVEQARPALALSSKIKLSLYKKSSNSGISVNILEEVYRRGYSIWNEKFKGTKDQFAFDRVNSFIAGGFAADLDRDLIENTTEYHSKNKNKPSSRFDGSDELVDIYKNMTPGQKTIRTIKKVCGGSKN